MAYTNSSNFAKMFCAKSPFKKFEPHNMYKTERANTKADHNRLKEKGYDHNPYKKTDKYY